MKCWSPVVAAAAFLALAFVGSIAKAAPANLPDSAVGKLGGELIHHVNADTAEQIRKWAPTVLSPAIDAGDRADFVNGLVSAVRESGGVELTEAHTQQGMLVLTVRVHHGGRMVLFVLAADPAQPGKLGHAELFPMDDPAAYAGWPKTAVSRAQMKQLIHAALDHLVRADDFSGCVTVADGGETVFDECRGLAERDFGVPVDHQTRFRMASVGKMFTAVAIGQLVEAGKLSWDSTLARLVPEYPDRAAAKKITVWELLHHTSGLGDFFVPAFFEHREKYVDPADYLELIARQPKHGEPGKDFNYSNAGYVLLGRIIENVSHEGYFDYIQRHVFAPAGMGSSGFNTLDEVTPKLAAGYFHESPFSTKWKANWMKIPFKGSPAGDSYSTNADLLRFAEALRSGKLLKPATLAEMFKNPVPMGPGAIEAGFGERLSHGRHIRGHQGGIEGETTDLAMIWETGGAVALTSNEGQSQSWLLAEHIADLLAAEPATTP
ncbi:MAG TPA: serine hydrolase domain-containing protein [Rhodanobacteraceae bacterium]|nr:serine hydrolase domain-containing protein [Rhodanobacteraceae bacterium]